MGILYIDLYKSKLSDVLILLLTAIVADAYCSPIVNDLPYVIFCGPHDQQGCNSLTEWCEWKESASSLSHQPMSAGTCDLKPGFDKAFAAYCTGTTEADCMAGAGSAYCDFNSSSSGSSDSSVSSGSYSCDLKDLIRPMLRIALEQQKLIV